jgi:hypothetical protein
MMVMNTKINFCKKIMHTLEGIASIDLAWLAIDFERAQLKLLFLSFLIDSELPYKEKKSESSIFAKNGISDSYFAASTISHGVIN